MAMNELPPPQESIAARQETDLEIALQELHVLAERITAMREAADDVSVTTDGEGRSQFDVSIDDGYRFIFMPPVSADGGYAHPRSSLWLVHDTLVETVDDLRDWIAVDQSWYVYSGSPNPDAQVAELQGVLDRASADQDALPLTRTTGVYIAFDTGPTDNNVAVTYGYYQAEIFASIVNEVPGVGITEFDVESWRGRLEQYCDSKARG